MEVELRLARYALGMTKDHVDAVTDTAPKGLSMVGRLGIDLNGVAGRAHDSTPPSPTTY
jgi:hypothetical protein